jgi:hypothetical protein
VWYRAKAAPARARPQRRVRGSIPASPPTKSALGYLANENASRSSLLFPVIAITGISDVNEIKHLAISKRISMRETLHLVFWGAGNVQLGPSRDQAGSAGIRSGRPGHGGWSGEIPRFFGLWDWPRGLLPVPPHYPIPPAAPFNPVDLSIIHWGSVAYIHERRPQVLLISFYDESGIF